MKTTRTTSLRVAAGMVREVTQPGVPRIRFAAVVFPLDPTGEPLTLSLDGPVVLGRDAGCDVQLADVLASRRHTLLSPVGDCVAVEDLGSRNGTFVDGRRVRRATAQVGSVVRIGNSLIRLIEAAGLHAVDSNSEIVGGAALASVRRLIKLVGPADLRVLILGESGTGKELVAKALHESSGRKGPFLAVNCAALPAALAESELFGHIRGAFTGAERCRQGLFVAADGGTLFLDEVGDLDPAVQAKLLRVLEDREVRPVGAERGERVDVRVLCATNGKLGGSGFRPELLARIAEVEIRLPPLRDRIEDLPVLISTLMARADAQPKAFEVDALEALAIYDWPQNVRELDNVVRGALLLAGESITLADLPERIAVILKTRRYEAPGQSPENTRARVEQSLLAHEGNVRRVSQQLGIARGHLYRLLKRWDLQPDDYRPGTRFVDPSEVRALHHD